MVICLQIFFSHFVWIYNLQAASSGFCSLRRKTLVGIWKESCCKRFGFYVQSQGLVPGNRIFEELLKLCENISILFCSVGNCLWGHHYLYLSFMRKTKTRPKTKPEASTLRRMVSQRELWTEIETLQHGVVRCSVPSSTVNKQSTVCEEDSYNNLTPSPLLLVTPFILLPSRTPIALSSKSPNKNIFSDSFISHPLSSCSHISPWKWKICMQVSATKRTKYNDKTTNTMTRPALMMTRGQKIANSAEANYCNTFPC